MSEEQAVIDFMNQAILIYCILPFGLGVAIMVEELLRRQRQPSQAAQVGPENRSGQQGQQDRAGQQGQL